MSVRLNYRRDGNGEPVLLLHGTGDRLETWEPVLPRLAAARDVIAVDLPGFGASPLDDARPPTPSGYADALAELLDELGVANAHVGGNSLGAWTGFELAKRGRARSVTAIAPAGLWAGRTPLYVSLSLRRSRVTSRLLEPVLPATVATAAGRTALLAQIVARPWRMPPRAAHGLLLAIGRAPGFTAHMDAVAPLRFCGGRDLDVPITVAFGTEDRFILPPWRRRDELPAATRWLTLRGCGHSPMWDDPEQVADVLLAGSGPAAPEY